MVVASFSKVLVLFTLAVSVSGLATPHVVRSPHGHHALAARKAAPAPSPAVGPYGRDVRVVKPRRKRRDSGRCKARTSTTSSTSSEAPPPTSSAEPVAAVAAAPSSSSSEAPPPPSETSTPAPAPSPESSTSEAPAPTSSDNGNSGNSGNGNSGNSGSTGGGNSNLPSFLIGTQTGQATFYDIGLGACGITNSGDDRIAAVSHLLFDQFPGYTGVNPNSNPICGKSVTATYQGKSTTVKITDRCEGCALTDLDFSPRAFEDLADFSLGRLSGLTWVWDN